MAEPGRDQDREELRREIQALERRVARLEERLELAAPPPIPAVPVVHPAGVALAHGALAIPVVGRALLGLAGAYLFRALTESHALPPAIGTFIGIVYAFGWLVRAARLPAGRSVASVLYSLTSALILAPLLWEATVRFHTISTTIAVAVLWLLVAIGLLISWRKNLLGVATVATLTGIVAAWALLVGSHDLVPFTCLLLAIAAAVEASACLDYWLSERWLAAAAADLAVLLTTYLATNDRGLPDTYVPVSRFALMAAQMTLPAIYLASTIVRTKLRGLAFTSFEAGQIAVALALGVGGGLRLMGAGSPIMALVCLGYAGVCYALSLALRRRDGQHSRNSRAYAWLGLLLVIAGSRILLPEEFAPVLWAALAVIAMAAGSQVPSGHGMLYLLAALAASGVLLDGQGVLFGSAAVPIHPEAALWATAASLACYGIAVHQQHGRFVRTLTAAAAFWLFAALLAAGLIAAYHGLFGETASHAYCATTRTMVLAVGAVLLGWLAARRRWTELKPLAYLAMAAGGYRLLLVDLRQDRHAALVLSLLFYGGALILLPRWLETPRTSAG